MGLKPIQFSRRNRPQIESINVKGVAEGRLKLWIVCDRRTHEGRANLFQHLILWALNNADKRKHILGSGDLRLRRLAVSNHRPQPTAPLTLDKAIAKRGRGMRHASGFEAAFNLTPDRLGSSRHGECGEHGPRIIWRLDIDRPQSLGERRRDLRAACARRPPISPRAL